MKAIALSLLLIVCFCGRSATATEIRVGLLAMDPPQPPTRSERVVGLPCEGCENVFKDLPAVLTSNARVAPIDEPGEPMHLVGRILNGTGKPAPGVIVYAYHTNQKGIYPLDEKSKPLKTLKLRGWAKADAQGRYAFDTIRPGSYPDRSDLAHIHMHVIEPGRCTYYIDNVVFNDDPLFAVEKATQDKPARGGSGMTSPLRDGAGIWQVTRDIHLGRNIPGYESCSSDSQRH